MTGAAVVVALLISEHRLLASSIGALKHVRWWWVAGAGVAGTGSMVALSSMHRRLLNVAGLAVTRRSTTAIIYASNAVSGSVPFAGSEVGTAYTFAQYQRLGADKMVAVWTLTVSGAMSSITFALLVSVGALASGSAVASVLGVLGVAGLLAAIGMLIVATRQPRLRLRLEKLPITVLQAAQRYTRRPGGDVNKLVGTALERMATLRLGRRDWAAVAEAALINWLADLACLALAIRGVGLHVPWSVLVLAWGAGASVNTLSLTPGGLGITEVAVAAGLVTTGHSVTAVMAAVLLYRLISYWIPMVVGWTTYIFHRPRQSPEPAAPRIDGPFRGGSAVNGTVS